MENVHKMCLDRGSQRERVCMLLSSFQSPGKQGERTFYHVDMKTLLLLLVLLIVEIIVAVMCKTFVAYYKIDRIVLNVITEL